jgi:NAD+ kinase
MMLEATGSTSSEQLLALNDMVLSRFRLGRVFQVAAYVDDDFVTKYVCDGMIVSTPTGSTAYNLSANGPIVHSEVESIIINPICPHTLTNRPLIVPPSSEVRLRVESEDECLLTADGQDKITDLNDGDEVTIWKSDQSITLINPSDRDFYRILRSKLHWSGRTSED